MSHFANKETRAPWWWVICPRSLSYLVVKLRINWSPWHSIQCSFCSTLGPGDLGSSFKRKESRICQKPTGLMCSWHSTSSELQTVLTSFLQWYRWFLAPRLAWPDHTGSLALSSGQWGDHRAQASSPVESSFTWDGSFIFFLFLIFVYFWLCWVFIAALRPYLGAVHGLLSVMVPLAAEPGL